MSNGFGGVINYSGLSLSEGRLRSRWKPPTQVISGATDVGLPDRVFGLLVRADVAVSKSLQIAS